MSNNVIERVTEFQTVAKLFAESGMFPDTRMAAQAFVKIMAGAEMGLPPFTAMNAFHIISGKVTLAAGTIAARIKGSGRYNYRIVEKTATRCSIEFLERGQTIHVETWDMARAKQAGVKNLDKFPDAMLFSRAISAGARVACPDVIGSYYTPEELGADVNEDGDVLPVVTIGAPQVEVEPIAQPAQIEARAHAAAIPAAAAAAPVSAPAKKAAVGNIGDAAWRMELTTLGLKAKNIIEAVADLPADQRKQLEDALTLAREALSANGHGTPERRTAAINALKNAIGAK